MGYRASIITHHRTYGDDVFYDFASFEEYFNKLQDLYPDDLVHQSEGQDYFEISNDVVNKEIERLVDLGVEERFEFQREGNDDTNETVIRSWDTAIKQSPKNAGYVALEWY